MALIDPDKTTTVEIPGEPGQTVTYRPLTAGDIDDIVRANGQVETMTYVQKSVVSWSYDVPPTLENIRRLDLETFNWLANVVQSDSGIREDEEKKDSDSQSSPTSDQETDSSRLSSVI